ncbi:IMP dehydrogenase [Patescibacteria group bacterium]
MRTRAVEELKKSQLVLNEWVYELPEPFESELIRIKYGKLSKPKALKFAFSIEGLENINKPNRNLKAPNYSPITKTENDFYKRYLTNENSKSLGVVVTDVDRVKSMIHKNGEPILWQMGPLRRSLALAQRAGFFLRVTDKKVLKTIVDIDSGKTPIPPRNNRRHSAVEKILGMTKRGDVTEARGLKELGYKKISAEKYVSRSDSARYGLFNRVGKYTRSYLGVGSLPACSGWRDVIVMSALANMPIFIARNNIFAENIDLQIQLVKSAQKTIKSLGLSRKNTDIALRNIGVAIGSNPEIELEKVQRLYKVAGVKLFRIYTINADPRVLETAVKIRNEMGKKIELFVGQISDTKQAKQLVDWAKVDGLIFGHGGGRQCTSAINGMAISAVEDLYDIVTNPHFNDTTILQEGGVGTNVGPLLVLGVDGILYNQQMTRGTIETGGVFLQDRFGNYGQPYHGSASAPTMIIESANPAIKNRINPSGRTRVPEGKPGFTKFTYKTNSMSFWIDEFRHHLARTLADLGVSSIAELREMLSRDKREFLRVVSQEASSVAKAYKS